MKPGYLKYQSVESGVKIMQKRKQKLSQRKALSWHQKTYAAGVSA